MKRKALILTALLALMYCDESQPPVEIGSPFGPPTIPFTPLDPIVPAPPGGPGGDVESAGLIVTTHGDSLFLQAAAVMASGETRVIEAFVSSQLASRWGIVVAQPSFSCDANGFNVKGLEWVEGQPGVRIVAYNRGLAPAAQGLALADERTAWLEEACNHFGVIFELEPGGRFDFGIEVKTNQLGVSEFFVLFDKHLVELAPGTDPELLSSQVDVR